MSDPEHRPCPFGRWKDDLVDDLERVALRDRWGRALGIMGWVHLAVFLACQFLYSRGDRASTHFLSLWALEFVVNLRVIRHVAGRGWHRSTPLAGILVRVWATFLILSFNVATLNNLTGYSIEWFKPVWATLSTFGFATTAYLVNVWYFAPAVQMYFTGLLMVLYPDWQYLIYGVSWWAAFQGMGVAIERRRAMRDAEEFAPIALEDQPAEEALAERT